MSASLLEVTSLEVGYGPIQVLKSASLSVQEGEMVTLIGANGAGKTTMLLSISGILPAWRGQIYFAGEDITALPAEQIVARGLIHVPEGRKIFPRMTVLENLQMGAFLRCDRQGIQSDLDRVYHLFPILTERRSQMGGTLSGGEQQMLAIARALMGRPKLLLMDEPSMGIAPLLVLKIFQTIAELNRQGLAVLLVEQNAKLALKTAARGYVLETGAVVLNGTSAELLHHPRVRAAYLGEE